MLFKFIITLKSFPLYKRRRKKNTRPRCGCFKIQFLIGFCLFPPPMSVIKYTYSLCLTLLLSLGVLCSLAHFTPNHVFLHYILCLPTLACLCVTIFFSVSLLSLRRASAPFLFWWGHQSIKLSSVCIKLYCLFIDTLCADIACQHT